MLFDTTFDYEIGMPGKIISANTAIRHGENPVWKIDAFKILNDDYLLQVQSRKINILPLIFSLIFIVGVGIFIVKYR